MRQIKFRGKRIDGKGWAYGSLIIDTENDLCDITWFDFSGQHVFEVEKETIGQFTSLLDKNGKGIYKSDIGVVKNGDPFAPVVKMLVVEEMGCFGVLPITSETDVFGNKYTGKMLPFYPEYKASVFEIVGNIHDNPELLK